MLLISPLASLGGIRDVGYANGHSPPPTPRLREGNPTVSHTPTVNCTPQMQEIKFKTWWKWDNIFSSTTIRISHGNLCHLIGRYTKHSQTKIEFVQTTGQAVMHASQWSNLKHSSSTNWRLHGPILPASMLKGNLHEEIISTLTFFLTELPEWISGKVPFNFGKI